MRQIVFAILAVALPTLLAAQSGNVSYARIAVLQPHDGDTVDFEAGYIRHLDWHRQAQDPWTWFGWTVWAGERQRWFVYATFGHAVTDFDKSVAPADDERDNIANVTPHARFAGNAIFEYLPALSKGDGQPQPTTRLEFTTIDLVPGTGKAFEDTIAAEQGGLEGETLWYRMIAGGPSFRYLRLRPRPTLAALLGDARGQALPAKTASLVAKSTVEILSFRPTMSYGLTPPQK